MHAEVSYAHFEWSLYCEITEFMKSGTRKKKLFVDGPMFIFMFIFSFISQLI